MRNYARGISTNLEAVMVMAALVAAATVAPLIKEQFITGTIVNATLFLGVALLGREAGILIGIVPSSIALAVGLLPPVLAPMVPFIIISNALLVLAFSYLSKWGFWIGAAVAVFLKFVFLAASTSVVVGLLLNQGLARQVSAMMSWPQLVTAAAGSVVAYGLLGIARKRNFNGY